MPPQGGGDFSDYEIARAVVYMTNKAGASFPEPAPPRRAAPATTTAAANTGGTGAAATARNGDRHAAPTAAAAPTADASAKQARRRRSPPAPRRRPRRRQPPQRRSVYAQACATCHAAGIAGAPKVGDKAAWAPRIAQGIDVLTTNVIKGKGAMPPQGRVERQRRRHQGRRHLHGERVEVGPRRFPLIKPASCRLFQSPGAL